MADQDTGQNPPPPGDGEQQDHLLGFLGERNRRQKKRLEELHAEAAGGLNPKDVKKRLAEEKAFREANIQALTQVTTVINETPRAFRETLAEARKIITNVKVKVEQFRKQGSTSAQALSALATISNVESQLQATALHFIEIEALMQEGFTLIPKTEKSIQAVAATYRKAGYDELHDETMFNFKLFLAASEKAGAYAEFIRKHKPDLQAVLAEATNLRTTIQAALSYLDKSK